jgi:hypothetical protein
MQQSTGHLQYCREDAEARREDEKRGREPTRWRRRITTAV